MTWDPHSSCSTRTSDAPQAFLQQMDPDKKWVPFTSTTGGGGARSIHKESKTCCSKSFQVAKASSQVSLITTQYVMNYFTQDFPKPAFCLASLCILVSFPCFSIGTTPLVGFAVLFKSMALGGYKHCTDTKN